MQTMMKTMKLECYPEKKLSVGCEIEENQFYYLGKVNYKPSKDCDKMRFWNRN